MPKDYASSRISRPRASTLLGNRNRFCTCLPSRATRRSYRHGVLQLADWCRRSISVTVLVCSRLSPGSALVVSRRAVDGLACGNGTGLQWLDDRNHASIVVVVGTARRTHSKSGCRPAVSSRELR